VKTAKSTIIVLSLALLFVSVLASTTPARAQKGRDKSAPVALTLTRTTTRHENRHLAYGGTVSIAGAPAGAITIEGWQRNEVEITAEIELRADTEENLALLAVVNNFTTDLDADHLRILTTGTHDKSFMKQYAKKFPKNLIGLPWKIDFHIKIPALTDLEVDAGNGPIKLSGVEGAVRINALESNALLSLTGGDAVITIRQGTINLRIPAQSWHGLGADIRIASGEFTVELPPDFSADVNAEVLRNGRIENTYPGLAPRDRETSTARSLHARAGNGGATLTFTVGDGTMRIKQSGPGG
jgi:hypothetical protein